jgi:hypothetical protein
MPAGWPFSPPAQLQLLSTLYYLRMGVTQHLRKKRVCLVFYFHCAYSSTLRACLKQRVCELWRTARCSPSELNHRASSRAHFRALFRGYSSLKLPKRDMLWDHFLSPSMGTLSLQFTISAVEFLRPTSFDMFSDLSRRHRARVPDFGDPITVRNRYRLTQIGHF